MLSLLLLACLVDQRLVNVRNDSSTSNGSLQRISQSGKNDCKQGNSTNNVLCQLTLMRLSSSSSPRMASCRCLGVIRLTYKCTTLGEASQAPASLRSQQDQVCTASANVNNAHLQVLGGISSQLQNLCCQIFCDTKRHAVRRGW